MPRKPGACEALGRDYAGGATVTAGKTVFRKLRALIMRALPGMRHLRLCRDCRRYLEAYKWTITLSQAACQDPDAPIPEDVPEELVQAILAARDKDA